MPNAAVDLLIDGSRSMNLVMDPITGQTRMEVAMESSLALALALEAIPGVNPAVTRFPYRRTDAVVPLLKHGQKVRSHAAAFLAETSGNTPLHTALWYAAVSVLTAPEALKIIMVLTDGRPDNLAATLAVIQRCEAAGIKLVGIGIGINTSRLFRQSVVIHQASDLKRELFKISSRLLMAA